MPARAFRTVQLPSISASGTASAADLNKTHFTISQMQANVQSAFKPLLRNPIAMNFQTIESVSLISGAPNTIDHGLGQTLQGWSFSRPKGVCVLWEDASQPNLELQIVLWAQQDVTTDIIVW